MTARRRRSSPSSSASRPACPPLCGTVGRRPPEATSRSCPVRSRAAASRCSYAPKRCSSRDEEAEPGAPGRVVHTSFLGALARVTLATDAGELLAQLPAVAATGLGPGTPVSWRLTTTPALAVPVRS